MRRTSSLAGEKARVCVGVHVRTGPEQLETTLASLRANTSLRADLLVLADGPDPSTAAALERLEHVAVSGTRARRGPAACFNRLVAAGDAAVSVFLESGALVGPGWLEELLAALDSDPKNGLAGPSTNRCWNEQALFTVCDGTSEEIAVAARRAARLATRTWVLEPLLNLADFCYAVRREVVEVLGAADEGYGLGPCWEMEYNARASRAGFRGVWARRSFVYRAPTHPDRLRDEALRLDASKRRYQDSLCALRLRGAGEGYRDHCRGEACEYFAPADLIAVRRPLRRAGPRPLPLRRGVPLVTCIMPTRDRPDFALRAVRYFQRQTYPARELVIVDDGVCDLGARLPRDERIRYIRLPAPETIGAKRNHACEHARGAILAQWDDDDWYGRDRLRAQVEPLLAGDADITALSSAVLFDLEKWEFWTATPELHRRLFLHDVHGGTLVFSRRVWEHLGRYPLRSLAEDAAFLARAVRHGARLGRIPGEGLFVYVRHGRNSWSLPAAGTRGGWERTAEPRFPTDDRAFYRAKASAPEPTVEPPPERRRWRGARPLVTCIMPTADRRAFVPRAIRYFQQQDYGRRELVILDDGRDRVGDLVPSDRRIRYVELDPRRPLGAKRNLACELARGKLIVHWDDDDWMAGYRLSYQVAELERHDADICGARRLLFFDAGREQAWLFEYPARLQRRLLGNTLCYRRSLWGRRPFLPVAVGEDGRFVRSREARNAVPLADHRFVVGVIHRLNASPKNTADPRWTRRPLDDVKRLLGPDLNSYMAATPGEPSLP